MVETVERLAVLIEANTKSYERAMVRIEQKTNRAVRGSNRSFNRLDRGVQKMTTNATRSLLRLGAAFGGIQLGRKLIGDFIKFDESLTKIITLVGVSRTQVEAWRGELVKLGPSVAKGPAELADALFFITSAGLRGSVAMDTLKASAQGAALGLGETKTVADAATSAMNAYGHANLSGAKAVAILVATVREGKAEADAISGSLGSVIPLASALGVEMSELGAAIAAMTRLGTSADEATTQLNAIFQVAIKSGPAARAAMEKYGLSMEGMRKTLDEDGLLALLQDVTKKVKGNKEAISAIFPSTRALRGIFNLMGVNVAITEGIFARMAKTTAEDLGPALKDLAVSDAFRLKVALAEMGVIMTDLSENIIPKLVRPFESLSRGIQNVAGDLVALKQAWDAWWSKGGFGEDRSSELSDLMNAAFNDRNNLQNTQLRLRNSKITDQGGAFNLGPFADMNNALGAGISGGGSITKPEADDGGGGGGTVNKKIESVTKALELQLAQLSRTSREQAIYNELTSAGVERNTEAGKKIELLTGKIFDQEAATTKLTAQMDSLRDSASDVLSGFISDLRSGASAVEIMNNALNRMLDKLLEMATSNILAGLFGPSGGTGGGILGSIISGFFKKPGLAAGGPIGGRQARMVGERGPEMFVPSTAGRIHSNSSIGGGAVPAIIQIFNTTGEPVRTESGQERGQPVERIFIGAVKSRMARGEFDDVLRGRFGARAVVPGR